ncbi:MAG: hypothetical protein MRY63_11930 [Neomegalonema sp.]|nr:hypothetical protein [Neomegalonema sp.]
MNPEFVRNLILQCSKLRLVAAPLVLGMLFLIVSWGERLWQPGVFWIAQMLIWAIAILWGARLAADSVAEEMRERTWDQQRLSGLGPWQMTWGKILGATSYTWLVIGLCILALVVSQISFEQARAALTEPGAPSHLRMKTHLEKETFSAPIAALFLQPMMATFFLYATAFFAALLALVGQDRQRGLDVTLFQAVALLAFLMLYFLVFAGQSEDESPTSLVEWWVPLPNWLLLSLSFGSFALAALLGSYHQMRRAFAMSTNALPWIAFLIFAVLWMVGFSRENWDLLALLTLGAAAYAAVLLEPHRLGRYRRWLQAGTRAPLAALISAPAWIYAWVASAIIALLIVARGGLDVPDWADPVLDLDTSWAVIAAILFMLRDIGIAVWAGLRARDGRGLWAALLLLAILDFILPVLSGLAEWPYLFIPLNEISAGAALVQALIVWALNLLEAQRPISGPVSQPI